MIGLMFLACVSMTMAGTIQVDGGILKQSTAVTIPVGPFEDDAGDGVLVTVTPNDMNATFVYSDGTQVENTDLSAATNLLTVINGTDPDAWATILITAANTANLGPLIMTLWDDGGNICEPITYRFQVVTADYYNTMFTASTIATAADIATTVWQDATAGDFTVASSIGKALYVSNVAPGGAGGLAIVGSAMTLADDSITAAKIATNAISASKIAANAIGASEIATDAAMEIASGGGPSVSADNVSLPETSRNSFIPDTSPSFDATYCILILYDNSATSHSYHLIISHTDRGTATERITFFPSITYTFGTDDTYSIVGGFGGLSHTNIMQYSPR
jgi:hypothetical protein